MAKKYRVSTTISPRHYEMLKKHSTKYDSQQSLLEHALESLENNGNANQPLTPDDELWLRVGKEMKKRVLVVHKDMLKLVSETVDIESHRDYTSKYKPLEFAIEFLYQKPIKKCSLPELMDAIVIMIKIQNTYETINYTDEGDYYSLNLIHKLGMNFTRIQQMMLESLFKSYGVRAESTISEISIFTKIYKRENKGQEMGDG